MVECNLAKVDVAGSNPVSRSIPWRLPAQSSQDLLAGGVSRRPPALGFRGGWRKVTRRHLGLEARGAVAAIAKRLILRAAGKEKMRLPL